MALLYVVLLDLDDDVVGDGVDDGDTEDTDTTVLVEVEETLVDKVVLVLDDEYEEADVDSRAPQIPDLDTEAPTDDLR